MRPPGVSEQLGSHGIAGDFADKLGSGGEAAVASWCIDPKSGLILPWEFAPHDSQAAHTRMTAVAVGKPPGEVVDPTAR